MVMVDNLAEHHMGLPFLVYLGVEVLGNHVGGECIGRAIGKLDLVLSCVKDEIGIPGTNRLSIMIVLVAGDGCSLQFTPMWEHNLSGKVLVIRIWCVIIEFWLILFRIQWGSGFLIVSSEEVIQGFRE